MGEAWVVMAVRIGGNENFWAWCRPNRDHPGFDEIYYTKRDGITSWSPSGDELPPLGEHLFTVVFYPEVASSGDRFLPSRDGSGLAPDPEWRPETPTLVAAEIDAGGA